MNASSAAPGPLSSLGHGAHAGSGPELPDQTYQIIYADPPWSYYGDPNKDQAAGKHYTLMATEEIAALPVRDLAARHAALFLWATGPRLPEAIEVMRAWGFHYRGIAYVWVKTARDGHIISGQGIRPTFTKPTTELLLVGSTNARGRTFPLMTEAQGQVVLAPRGQHSEKPDVFRDRIVELLGDRPRIELFARTRPAGWDVWGNECSAAESRVAPSDLGAMTDNDVPTLRPLVADPAPREVGEIAAPDPVQLVAAVPDDPGGQATVADPALHALARHPEERARLRRPEPVVHAGRSADR